MTPGRRAAAALLALALVVGACGGDDDDSGLDDGTATISRLTFTYALTASDQVDLGDLEDAVAARLSSIGIGADAVDADDAGVVTVALEDDDLADLATDLLTQQGILRFRPVLAMVPGEAPELPLTPAHQDRAELEVVLPERDDTVVSTYRLGPTQLDVTALEGAKAVRNEAGSWEVQLLLLDTAIEPFNRIASLCFAKAEVCPLTQLALVVDGEVVSAPQVAQPSFERDQIVIASATFTEAEARRLAAVLEAGPLPVALTLSSTG